MAATIQSLFPFTTNRGEDFTIYPVVTEFRAPIVAGKYVFSEATTPAQVFGKLLQGQIGIIAGVMISANCTSENFTRGIDTPLELQILQGGNNTRVNMAPFPFSAFAHGDNFQAQWKITAATINQEDDFKLAVVGSVNQLTGMTENELILRIAFNFIRANEKKILG